jgi:hypothetical protein
MNKEEPDSGEEITLEVWEGQNSPRSLGAFLIGEWVREQHPQKLSVKIVWIEGFST